MKVMFGGDKPPAVQHAGLANIRPPQPIDLSDPAWSPAPSDGKGPDQLLAIFCANVIHIAPWRVAEGLFAGAARHLRADGRLILYGPFKRGGKHTALSNAVFDTSLRERDAEWGVRDIADLETLAESVGLKLAGTFEMPANNMGFLSRMIGGKQVGCGKQAGGYSSGFCRMITLVPTGTRL